MDRKQARDEIYSGEEKKVTVAVKERRNLMAQVKRKGWKRSPEGQCQYHSVRIVRLIEKVWMQGGVWRKGRETTGDLPLPLSSLSGFSGLKPR